MTTTLLRAGALSCALLASTALVSPASAQTLWGEPVRQAPDSNGVDVISGHVTTPFQSVSVGQPGQGGLAFENGYAAGSYHDTLNLTLTDPASAGLGNTRVTLGGQVFLFNRDASGNFTPWAADGSTLVFNSGTNSYTLTLRDGTVVEFLKSWGGPGYGANLGITARGTTITRPNGEVITYTYTKVSPLSCGGVPGCTFGTPQTRPQSITNNFGYQLKPAYVADTFRGSLKADFLTLSQVQAINNAVDYCSPSANSCTGLTQSWPTLSLSDSTSGSTVTHTATDSLSQTTTVIANATGITSRTSPADPASDFSISYDGNSRVQTLTSGGGSWGYTYADVGTTRTTTVTQPGGGSRVYVSDQTLGRVTSVTDELGRVTAYQYDASGRLTRTTLPEGNYVTNTYDARGNVTETRAVAKSGTGLPDMVTSASFDASCSNMVTCNQPNSTTDERGNVTNYTYDSTHGGVLTVTAPAPGGSGTRPEVRMTYAQQSAWYKNAAGSIVSAPAIYRLTAASTCQTGASPACVGTADEVRTTVDYGTGSSSAANNLLPVSVSSGAGDASLTATTASAYDSVGNVTSVDGPLAGSDDTTGYRYDANRQLTMVVSPDPDGAGALPRRAQQTTYDGDGRPILVKAGTTSTLTGAFTADSSGARVRYTYDSLGRRASAAQLSGGLLSPTIETLTQYSYDTKGRPECTAVRMNPATFASPPSSACSLATAGSFGPDRITRTSYDTADQVTKVETGYATADVANEMQATYRNNGQVETVTDANGNVTTNVYDGLDRLSRTRMPDPSTAGTSSATDYRELIYATATVAGNTVSTPLVSSGRMRDGSTLAFSYDALNRPIVKTPTQAAARIGTAQQLSSAQTRPVYYAYDLLGRLTEARFDNLSGEGVSNSWDALGRLASSANSMGGTSRTLSYQYDLAGNRTRITHPDSAVFDQSYDGLNRPQLLSGPVAGTPYYMNYGANGLPANSSRNTCCDASYFGYDNALRLSSLYDDHPGTGSDVLNLYSRNPAGGLSSQTRDNDAFAYTGHANANVTATANGLNQLTALGGASLAYDPNGNLTSDGTNSYIYDVENRLVGRSNGNVALVYDPLGRLFQVSSTAGATQRFLYDGDALVAEYDGSGTMTHRYLHTIGADVPVVQYNGSGLTTPYHLFGDRQGSIVAASDGTTTSVNSYDEYGVPAAGNTGRFQYTGQIWLPELGLYYYKARLYNPAMGGRFMQTDPIGFGGGMNWYAYVGNNPVNFSDPLGLDPPCGGEGQPTCPPPPDPNHVFVTGPFLGGSIFGGGRGPAEPVLQPGPVFSMCFLGDCEHEATVTAPYRRNGVNGVFCTGSHCMVDEPPIDCDAVIRRAEAPTYCQSPLGNLTNVWTPSTPSKETLRKRGCEITRQTQDQLRWPAHGVSVGAFVVRRLGPVAAVLEIFSLLLDIDAAVHHCE